MSWFRLNMCYVQPEKAVKDGKRFRMQNTSLLMGDNVLGQRTSGDCSVMSPSALDTHFVVNPWRDQFIWKIWVCI